MFFSALPQGLLPRGEKPNPLRQKNAKVNQLLKVSLPKLANVQLLDTDGGFVHSDGAISCHDMFDFLHLTGGGYAKICKPLHELIMQLLEETPEEKQTTIAWLAPVSVNSIQLPQISYITGTTESSFLRHFAL